ncbi:MAG: methylase [Ruminococcaceae bacterium]|nr:methylase [Oscillospiraceae bacterium]
MAGIDRKKAAKAFAEYWKDKGYEKGESQSFWLSLLRDVLGVENPEQTIIFEEQVRLDHTSFIDGHIPSTHVLIEQKGRDKDLRKPIKQSDGTFLTPFQQARRYSAALSYSQRPRWIIVCNFQEFLIYDMEKNTGEPESILLSELSKEYYRLQFLVEEKSELAKREEIVSIRAGELVGKLYDAILKQYIDPSDKASLHSLNILCVRLVFCLYAEDSGIFGGDHNKFHNYIKSFDVRDVRRALIDLFKVLDTKIDDRDKYLDERLGVFPYVNGGLFADENIEIPNFTQEIVDLLLHKASEDFDWSQISPTIFGAVFESTLNPETRRGGGMHYTSIENIHKVTKPLFLDELCEELDNIKAVKVSKIRKEKAEAFRKKLSELVFLDPACGSGNFLTQTYIDLRRLENEALKIINEEQIIMDFGDVIKVSLGQFYGIEINDFAVTVAKTALWIAESQMMKETEEILETHLEFLPLKSYANIVEGNALRIDWESVVPKDKLDYIMGNPPFVGQAKRSKAQSKDMADVFGDGSSETKLDYVLCWYKKSLDLINDISHKVSVGFVSTNSICQGESVPTFWRRMFDEGAEIIFAHRSFKWSSESSNSAAVVCVIVGFCKKGYTGSKYIFDNAKIQKVPYINAYLQNAPDVWITSRSASLSDNLPKMIKGSEPTDGGNLFITEQEKDYLESKYPLLQKYIRPFVGGDEFLSNPQGKYSRYCLWFLGGNPHDFVNIPEIKDRLKNIAQKREQSSADRIRKRALFPYLFCQIRQPENNYLLFPRHTTSSRRYIPLGFIDNYTIVGDACYIIPNASLYLFGIMMSNVHMAWVRLTCGRLGNGYRYSPAIYNNFPWPTPTAEQKKRIEETAQAILDARALYPDCSLADLYDEVAMPPELRRAHQANDRAVMQAYGFDIKTTTESSCVAELMKMYQELTK